MSESREDRAKYGSVEVIKRKIKIPPRQIKTNVPSYLLHCKVLLNEGRDGSAETQAAIIESGIEKVEELTALKDLAKLKLALELINEELNLPDEVILDTLYDPRYCIKLRRSSKKMRRTAFWIDKEIGGKVEQVSNAIGLSYNDLAYLALLCVCITSQKLPPKYKERASVDLKNALLDVEEIKKNWLSLVDAAFKYFIAQSINKGININLEGLKNSAGEVYKPHDNMTTCQHDRGCHVLHDRGYKGERLTHAFNLIKSISPEYAQRIDAHLRIYESQQLFELEKQLPTQSLDEEIVRAEYRFFNHYPKYTEIRAINPQGKNKIIQFVNNEDDFLEYVKAFDGKWQVYLGINRRYRLGSGEGGAGTINDVDQVGAIIVDIDCKRANKKEPASDLELEAAFAVCNKIALDFVSRGFKAPIRVMSGNGWQLRWAIPPIELDDSNRMEINWKLQEFQRFIKANYENEYVEIDNIGDIPRIIKVCGTKSIKGLPTPERPHRYSYALDPIIRDEDPKLREFILSFEKGDKPDSDLESKVVAVLFELYEKARTTVTMEKGEEKTNISEKEGKITGDFNLKFSASEGKEAQTTVTLEKEVQTTVTLEKEAIVTPSDVANCLKEKYSINISPESIGKVLAKFGFRVKFLKTNGESKRIVTLDFDRLKSLKECFDSKDWKGNLDFKKLCEKDEKLCDLYEGRWQRYGYKSRSEAELALICKLVYYGFSKSEIWRIMDNSDIGKWKEKPESYKELTYSKALGFIGNKRNYL